MAVHSGLSDYIGLQIAQSRYDFGTVDPKVVRMYTIYLRPEALPEGSEYHSESLYKELLVGLGQVLIVAVLGPPGLGYFRSTWTSNMPNIMDPILPVVSI